MRITIQQFLSVRRIRNWVTYLLLILSIVGSSCYAVGLSIKGIDNKAIKENVVILVGATDVLQQQSLDPFWQKQIRDTVSSAVEPYGYYDSNTTVRIDDKNLTIEVALGEPLVIANLNREILGEGRDNDGFHHVFYNYPQKVGDKLYQPAYEKYKTDMFNYALSHGFFDFNWQITSIDVVRETHSANLLLVAQSGPQYYFGDITIKGDPKAIHLIRRISPFKAGDKYDSALLTKFNRALNETGYFQRVIARPVVKQAVNKHVPIEITLTHRPRDNFDVGIGVSTDTGVRLPFSWDRPWIGSRGHSLSGGAFLSEREQEITTEYHIPLQDVANDYATFNLSYSFLDDDNQDSESETFTALGSRFWREPDSKWQYSTSLTYLTENFTQGAGVPTTTELLLPGISVTYSNGTGDLGHRNGVLFSTSLQAGSQEVISDIDIVKTEIESKWIQTFGKHRLYLRGQLGLIDTNNFNSVPSTLRFFTGGDQSVRGFAFQSVSSGQFEDPDDEDGDGSRGDFEADGGRYLATASVEYAYAVSKNWRAAVFADVGTASNDFGEGFASSVGIGAHWITIVGPIRLYLAAGQNSIEDQNTLRVHFILGPEL